jgi:maltooligosyltrehalose trehalohydrolase
MNTFSVWAPGAGKAEVEVAGQRYSMTPDASGWWSAEVPDVAAGIDYGFRLDDDELLPDPRSLRQPFGIKGPSRTYDHSAFRWTDRSWRGGPLHGSVIYEMHVGTFTAEGTFDAAIGRLDHLRHLGVNTVELMPVAAFPGRHGWGYDGINLWAVHEPYGGPDGLKRFVDACHARGLAVLLDVVYSHVGIGNRLGDFGPYFTEVHVTPWGPAVNLGQPGSDEVWAFLIGNALMWLRDYHLDGLRLEAVHAFEDRRSRHFLQELSAQVQALAAMLSRELILVAESDANDPQLVTSREAGGYGLTGQWSDDFHHAVHAAITGERQGYYCDFGSMAALAKTYTRVFFHDGTWSAFRGRTHGRQVDVSRIPAHRFLGYLQNHDQVGNRATGDRIAATLAPDLVKVGAGLILTGPYTPMLFMGEEWGADTPWQYFTDHIEPWLAQAVAEGRRAEFAGYGWDAADVPDPQDEATFLRSKLDWEQRHREPYLGLLAWYQELIALRRARPELTDPRLDRVQADFDENARWLLVRRGRLRIAANLGAGPVRLPLGQPGTGVLTASRPGVATQHDTVTMPPASFTIIETSQTESRMADFTIIETSQTESRMAEREGHGHAFISYVREDAVYVDQLQAALEDAGIPVWRDVKDLWPGEVWKRRVRDEIAKNSLAFIPCFSRSLPKRARSTMYEELTWAAEEYRKRNPDVPWIFPVLFEECDVPTVELGSGLTLHDLQWVQLGQNKDGPLERLISALRALFSADSPG